MPRYTDVDGDSGVSSYELGDGWIKVTFKDGSTYTYTNQSAGSENIQRMHRLAQSGEGLNSFIMRVVKNRYASKQ